MRWDLLRTLTGLRKGVTSKPSDGFLSLTCAEALMVGAAALLSELAGTN